VIQAPPPAISAGDTAWVLASSALVLLMTVGLACFYGGLVRSKNSLNTMMMSIVAMGAISVQWVLVGYSLSFAPGSSWLGGLQWVLFRHVGGEPNPAYAATIPQHAHAIYQAMFAIITPALISGAIVERMRFRAYLAFLVLWSTVVYAPLAHWVWGAGGWLQQMGALDFAGGTVVHISAGVSALVAARFLGPRRDFRRMPLSPHNVPLVLIGAGLLWFGWFGFNAGSALAANGLAALAFVNTNTAAAAAVLTWALLDTTRTGRLDDSLDVFSCHGLAGVAGALLTGVFATKLANPAGNDGLFAGNPGQMLVQLYAVLAAVIIAAVGTVVILAIVRAVFGARAQIADEMIGLDLTEHGEEAYFGGEAALGVSSLAQSVIVAEDPGPPEPERRAAKKR